METDPYVISMVSGHKKKVLQMIHREGQVDYFGKKGTILL